MARRVLIDRCTVNGVVHAQVEITKGAKEDLEHAFCTQVDDPAWNEDNPEIIANIERLYEVMSNPPSVKNTTIHLVRHEDLGELLEELDTRLDIHDHNQRVGLGDSRLRRLMRDLHKLSTRCAEVVGNP
ncbi:MAG: hypothetical protein ACXABY_33030 [Candidatus Thorarchaeota archaeon]|jgi:hypothetical protein